jgi:hypothetical protein
MNIPFRCVVNFHSNKIFSVEYFSIFATYRKQIKYSFELKIDLRLTGHKNNGRYTSPTSSAGRKERIELYFYFPLGLRGLLQGEIYGLPGNITHHKKSVTI